MLRFCDMQQFELTVLMPARNEAISIAHCISEAKKFIAECSITAEIVVVDNLSTDETAKIALGLGARVVPCDRPGYGSALRAGLKACQSSFVIFGDSDGSYDFYNVHAMLGHLRAGADVVIGNRFLGGIDESAMPWKNRWIGTPIISLVGNLRTGLRLGDYNCGLRGLRLDVLPRLNLQASGMEFASEMILASARQKLDVRETPVRLRRDLRAGPGHLRPWRDGLRHLSTILKLNWD